MTETIALVRAIGHKYFLIPYDPAMGERVEEVEKLCFGIMNTTVYLKKMMSFALTNTHLEGSDFDPEYAGSKFSSDSSRSNRDHKIY